MGHMAADFYIMPSYGNQVRERGEGRMLGPPGIHAGMPLLECTLEIVSDWQKEDPTTVAASVDRAMDALGDVLMMVDSNGEHSQAMVTETINMCKVSESYEARNSKNRNPNVDEQQSWGEGSSKIQIEINGAPNFRAALPRGATEETTAKLDQFSGRDLRSGDADSLRGRQELSVGGAQEQTSGDSVAFVTDGPWDLEVMLPAQWRLAHEDAEVPAVFQQYVDLRTVFRRTHPSRRTPRAGKLHKMCRALAIDPVGPAHSGLADARNAARVALALMADGGVFAATPCSGEAEAAEEEPPAQELAAEALALLLGSLRGPEVASVCKDLRLSNVEQKFVASHVECLGHVPDGNNPGEVRRYVTAVGKSFAAAHWRLERAWAQAERDDEKRAAALRRLDAATATAAALDPESIAPSRLIFGGWLMEKTGVKPGLQLGRLKDWLYYLQVDQDIRSVQELEAALEGLDWQN
ncbi:unnamed protein product, partial [Prorocentrum cordatum]